MTKQPKVAVIIDDDPDWLSIFDESLVSAGFTVQRCQTFCDNPDASVFLVDARDEWEDVVGPGFVRTLRSSHPRAVIIGMSSTLNYTQPGATGTVQAQFLLAGANGVWNKSDSLAALLSLLK